MGNLICMAKKDGGSKGNNGSKSSRRMGVNRSQRKLLAEEELLHRQALSMALHQHQLSQRFDNGSMSRRIGSTSSRRKNLPDADALANGGKQDKVPENLENIKIKKFVLIHGEGFGAWCWYKTIAQLEEVGLVPVALDLTGSGIDTTDTNCIKTLAEYSKPLISYLENLQEDEKSTLLGDGQILNVIDTPGLFDFSVGADFAHKEIAKCINMAKNGIHAVVLVFSVRNRFTEEEEATIRNLQSLFGKKIIDYMVVLFTGGDELEDNDETLEGYLGDDCPRPLKEILSLCKNRKVLFDNKTKDEFKRAGQVEELLALVNNVVMQNGGRPYTDDIFVEMQKHTKIIRNKQAEIEALQVQHHSSQEIAGLKQLMHDLYQEQLKHITEMVESKLHETTVKLEQQLAKEQAARLKAEEFAQLTHLQSSNEIRQLRENLESARAETERLREQAERETAILWLKRSLVRAQMGTGEILKRAESHSAVLWLHRSLEKAEKETVELLHQAEKHSAVLWIRESVRKLQGKLSSNANPGV